MAHVIAGISAVSFQAQDISTVSIGLPSALPRDVGSETHIQLWNQAYEQLMQDETHKPLLEDYEQVMQRFMTEDQTTRSTSAAKSGKIHEHKVIPKCLGKQEEMAYIVKKQSKLMQNKQWTIRWKGTALFKVRDQVDRIARVVQMVLGYASAAANIDPVHAGLPLAGICVILSLMLNDSEQRTKAVDGLEEITHIIARYATIEKLYLSPNNRLKNREFETAILRLYRRILVFEARVACYFGRRALSLLVRNIFKIDDWENRLSEVRTCDTECVKYGHVLSSNMLSDGMKSLNDVLNKQSQEIDKMLEGVAQRGKDNEKVITWISDVEVGEQHALVRDERLGSIHWNSGQWLLQSDEFEKWRKTSRGQFWLQGTVGTGKSCLTSIIINDLIENHTDERLVFFYCSRDAPNSNLTAILRSLVSQLSISADGLVIAEEIKSRYDKEVARYTTGNHLFPAECVNLLAHLIELHGNTTIVIDALDECDKPMGLLRHLKQVWHLSQKLKLFFSSRPDVLVFEMFPDSERVQIGLGKNTHDISSYIRGELGKPERRNPDVISAEMAERMVHVLEKRAQGMFRWVELQLALLISEEFRITYQEDFEESLKQLENSAGLGQLDKLRGAYDDLYERRITNLSKMGQDYSRQIAEKTLKWVLCAARPLKLAELADAVAIGEDGTRRKSVTKDSILITCGNFILTNQSGNVTFAHLSVREYLEARRTLDGVEEYSVEATHAQAATTCLSYLCNPDTSIVRDVHCNFPNYATLYWPEHCDMASEYRKMDGSLRSLFNDFLKNETRLAFTEWMTALPTAVKTLDWGERKLGEMLKDTVCSQPSPFFLACIWEFLEIMDDLLRASPMNLGRLNTQGKSGLVVASENGNVNVVQLLLEHGADDNARGNGETALFAAALYGHEAALRLLLRHGSDVNAQSNGLTALFVAARDGYKEVVRLLLGHGANVNAKCGKFGETTLSAAVFNRYKAVVQLLLEYKAEVNIKTSDGETLLYTAARDGLEAIWQLLLEHGADVNAKSNDKTVLYVAAKRGYEAFVRLLLQHGADVNAKSNGTTGLYGAAKRGHETVVRLLLEHGADVNAKSNEEEAMYCMGWIGHERVDWVPKIIGETALYTAAWNGHEVVVRLLLEHGADVNGKTDEGWTALNTAVGNEAVVRLLLEHGADVNAKPDDYGDPPLYMAVWKRHEAVVRLLLEHGADVNAKADCGRTALYEAASNKHGEVVRLLLEHGADVNAWSNGEKALHLAARNGYEAVAGLLLEHGADINAKDYKGSTALHMAAQKGHEAIVRLLLEHGAWDAQGS